MDTTSHDQGPYRRPTFPQRMLRDLHHNAVSGTGATMDEALPPKIEESLEITRAYWRRVRSFAWRDWRPNKEHELTAEEVERCVFDWDRLRRSFVAFMEHYDVILCPAAERPAGPHGSGRDEDFIYTLPYSLTGWPCVVVRAGTSPEGLPIGVQVVARPWRDDVALAVAHHIETTLRGWRPPPI